MTSTIPSWNSHCGISPVQVQVNRGSKPKNPRLLGRFGGGGNIEIEAHCHRHPHFCNFLFNLEIRSKS